MGANYGQLRQLAENLHRAEQGMTEFKRQLALGEGLYAVKQAKKICTDEDIIDTGNLRRSYHTDPNPMITPNTLRIDVHNSAKYASDVEYGHIVVRRGSTDLQQRRRAAMRNGRFVRGKYVLTRAIQRTLETQRARIGRKLNRYVKQFFGGGA